MEDKQTTITEVPDKLKRISLMQETIIDYLQYPLNKVPFNNTSYRYNFQLAGETLIAWCKELISETEDLKLEERLMAELRNTQKDTLRPVEIITYKNTFATRKPQKEFDHATYLEIMNSLTIFEILLKKYTSKIFPTPKNSNERRKEAY